MVQIENSTVVSFQKNAGLRHESPPLAESWS